VTYEFAGTGMAIVLQITIHPTSIVANAVTIATSVVAVALHLDNM
jgi:hypothetical protein